MDNLGTLYIKSGRFEEAHKLYTNLLNNHKSYLEGKVHYAQLMILERSFHKAEALLKSIIDTNTTYRDAYHQLGVLLIETNRTSEGLENILQTIHLCHVADTSRAQFYVYHGDLMKDMGDLETAAQSYEMAIRLDSGISHAHLNLGVVHHLEGRYLQALKHYKLAQSLDPHNSVVMENLDKLMRNSRNMSVLECSKESEFCRTW
ncbi:protein O-mannosyl-transferase TMTC1-like [Tachypleus tridentatus]|uniref:protein O-mannosyl-transferase TMTC1-like n=1 Tax=Tachypleus tridentatus TaxID=6853 RepID=UPI003FD2584F